MARDGIHPIRWPPQAPWAAVSDGEKEWMDGWMDEVSLPFIFEKKKHYLTNSRRRARRRLFYTSMKVNKFMIILLFSHPTYLST